MDLGWGYDNDDDDDDLWMDYEDDEDEYLYSTDEDEEDDWEDEDDDIRWWVSAGLSSSDEDEDEDDDDRSQSSEYGYPLVSGGVKKGDVIKAWGRQVRVNKVLDLTVKLEAEDLVNHSVKVMSFPLLPIPNKSESGSDGGPKLSKSEYFQVLSLLEKEVVVVNLRRFEKIRVKRNFVVDSKNTIEELKMALNTPGHDTFCYLIQVMGKEIMVGIKSLPSYEDKVPGTLGLDKPTWERIFSYLPGQDGLNARLVCRHWAHQLPIHSYMKCERLVLQTGEDHNQVPCVGVRFEVSNTHSNSLHGRKFHRFNDLVYLDRSGLLKSLFLLTINRFPSPTELKILYRIQGLERFCFNAYGENLEEKESSNHKLLWAYKIIANNKDTLLKCYVDSPNIKYPVDCKALEKCESLTHLTINASHVKNVGSIPKNVILILRTPEWKPKKDHLLWICKNTKLWELDIKVKTAGDCKQVLAALDAFANCITLKGIRINFTSEDCSFGKKLEQEFTNMKVFKRIRFISCGESLVVKK